MQPLFYVIQKFPAENDAAATMDLTNRDPIFGWVRQLARVIVCSGSPMNPFADLHQDAIARGHKNIVPFVIGDFYGVWALAEAILMSALDLRGELPRPRIVIEFLRRYLSGNAIDWKNETIIRPETIEEFLNLYNLTPVWRTDDSEPGAVGAST